MQVDKAGANVFLTIKQFSPQTGEELEPITQQLRPEVLLAKKKELQAQLEAIDEIIKDIDGKTEPDTKTDK